MSFVNVTTDQCLLLLVLFSKKPQVLPRDRTEITKKLECLENEIQSFKLAIS